MKKLRLDPEAAREFREAIEWYEEKREGLGDEFWTEAQCNSPGAGWKPALPGRSSEAKPPILGARASSPAGFLVRQFFTGSQKKLDMIQAHPEIGVRLDPISVNGVVRCVRLARFPYSVVDRLRVDELVVLAMAHQSRRPGYWRQR